MGNCKTAVLCSTVYYLLVFISGAFGQGDGSPGPGQPGGDSANQAFFNASQGSSITLSHTLNLREQITFSFRTCSYGQLIHQQGSNGDSLRFVLNVQGALEISWTAVQANDSIIVQTANSFIDNQWYSVNSSFTDGAIYVAIEQDSTQLAQVLLSNSTYQDYVQNLDLNGGTRLQVGAGFTGCIRGGASVVFNTAGVGGNNVLWQQCPFEDDGPAGCGLLQVNPCLLSDGQYPCQNGGACVNLGAMYQCDCLPPYSGANCQNDRGAEGCSIDPCDNDATCVAADFATRKYICACLDGFDGVNCEVDINACQEAPCQNGGLCQDLPNGFLCDCHDTGYTGLTCEDVDHCASKTCVLPGTQCVNQADGSLCRCVPGYYDPADAVGDATQCLPIVRCEDNPCQNGATCEDVGLTYVCRCAPGFADRNCQTNIDECSPNPCLNEASCIDRVADFTCQCRPMFTGRVCGTEINIVSVDDCVSGPCLREARCVNCEEDIDYCESVPCENGGHCQDGETAYTCTCEDAWMGDTCGQPYDECYYNPCRNGGTCQSELATHNYTCECVVGFEGSICQDNIDDCVNANCTVPRTCVDGVNTFTCECRAGYTGELCTETINYCISMPCQNGGLCQNVAGGYKCQCPGQDVNHTQYTGDPASVYRIGIDGVNCEIDIDECSYPKSICLNGGICQHDDEIEFGFRCYCPQGGEYVTGKYCEFKNDYCNILPDPPACHNGGTCIDIGDNYACTCAPGFTGNRCVTNIDECSSNPCVNSGTCDDQVNGYVCVCTDGYEGVNCEIDINECTSSPCVHGECIDMVNGYECDCTNTGFDGLLCDHNIDDCNPMPCSNAATCEDGIKSYTCLCHSGYMGTNCEMDVNECESDPCMNGGVCHQLSNASRTDFDVTAADGYLCACIPGFLGLHCETNIDECESNPCLNGNCTDGINGYTCECFTGYKGTLCETEIDECVLFNACQYGSVCVDLIGDYQCICPTTFNGTAFGGKDCVVPLTGCNENDCQNGATCVPYLVDEVQNIHNYSCQCLPGFYGHFCEALTTASFFGDTWLKYDGTNGLGDVEMTLYFATSLADGLLLLNLNDNGDGMMSLQLKRSTTLELQYNNFLLTSAKVATVVTPNSANLADGQWQQVNISVSDRELTLTLYHEDCDSGICQDTRTFTQTADSVNFHHSLGDTFYGSNATNLDNLDVEVGDFTSFTGCMRDLGVDGIQIIPADYVTDPDKSNHLVNGCSREDQCNPDPCSSHGYCTDLWFNFKCDCWRPYLGDICEESFIAATFGFSQSSSSAQFTVPPEDTTVRSTNNISMFFRTRETDGLLFYLGDDVTFVMSEVREGRVRIGVLLDTVPEYFDVDGYFSNGKQYFYNMYRKDQNVDWLIKPAEEMGEASSSPGTLSGSGVVLKAERYLGVDNFYIGGFPQTIPEGRRKRRQASVHADTDNPLRGTIQDARQNGYRLAVFAQNGTDIPAYDPPVLENVLEKEISDDVCSLSAPCQNNATCGTEFFNNYNCSCLEGFRGKNCEELDFCVYNECPGNATCNNLEDGYECVTSATFDGVTSMLQYSNTLNGSRPQQILSVEFRTRNTAGLLLHVRGNAPFEDYYITIELEDRNVHVNFDMGEKKSVSSSGVDVSNGEWQNVTFEILQNSSTLELNGEFPFTVAADNSQSLTDILARSSVFVGGADDVYLSVNSAKFASDAKFKGCMEEVRIKQVLLPFFEPELLANSTSVEQFNVMPGMNVSALVNNTGCFGDPVCDTNVCENNASCVDIWNKYECACLPGFNGTYCENDIDECLLDNECENGATCVDAIANYTCDCAPGYTAYLCDIEINECDSSPCQNNGTCIDQVAEFNCSCLANFTGDFCEIDINENCDATPNICQNNGTCLTVNTTYAGVDTFECECIPGFEGQYCESEIDYCEGDPCQNNATCVSDRSILNYTCTCLDGYTGYSCEIEIDECVSYPCQNEGDCIDYVNSFECNCTKGWEGEMCHVDIDECVNGTDDANWTSPCVHGGCENLPGSYLCNCDGTGYTGALCDTDINECDSPTFSMPCKNGAECNNTEGSYWCTCTLGYDGKNCEIPNCDVPNQCNTGNCTISGGKWSCDCPEFVEGDQCESPGPCVNMPCDNNATCSQSGDNYTCSCVQGWEGKNCTIDINECTFDPSPCLNGATCSNTAGSYMCMCVAGFTESNCGVNIDECESDPCQNTGKCVDLINAYVCNCSDTGYNGTNCEQDIDECEAATPPCMNGGACNNQPGYFECDCLEGFLGDTCHSKNPCNGTYCLNEGNCSYSVDNEKQNVSVVCMCEDPWYGMKCEFTEPVKLPIEEDNTLVIIIGSVIAGVVLIVIIVVIVVVVVFKEKRANRGAYSPSRQEMVGSRVEMGNVLKPPPEERLI